MAKAKLDAWQLVDDDSIASGEPQHFGSIPGLWMKGVPVLLDQLDPTLDDKTFGKLVKELGLPIEQVKVDADYKPKKGMSQLDLKTKGELDHIPAEAAGPVAQPGEPEAVGPGSADAAGATTSAASAAPSGGADATVGNTA